MAERASQGASIQLMVARSSAGGDIEPVSELEDDVERWVATATLQAAL